jgi:hypothetical protein
VARRSRVKINIIIILIEILISVKITAEIDHQEVIGSRAGVCRHRVKQCEISSSQAMATRRRSLACWHASAAVRIAWRRGARRGSDGESNGAASGPWRQAVIARNENIRLSLRIAAGR